MESLFDVSKFNIIEDEENYYFFRALNMADNQDLEKGIILDNKGNFERIRTDRERHEEDSKNGVAKYKKNDEISLEQVYDHIKPHYRKDTNCISLSSNSNVAIFYGRGFYKDKYIIVKVPKRKMGKKVVNACQYMLEEILKKINEYIFSISTNSELLKRISEIDNSKTKKEICKKIEEKYTLRKTLKQNRAKPRKEITYKAPVARISNYQALNEKQQSEKNKIIAKLTLLERMGKMEPLISNTINNNLLAKTIENAFSSLELIHYGDIEKNEIIDVQKEVVDIFSLLQQIEGQNQQLVHELKRKVIDFARTGKKLKIPEKSILNNYSVKNNISVNEIYKLVAGKIKCEQVKSIVEDMFFLVMSQLKARELAKLLRQIIGDNSKYENITQYIENNGFEIEPEIITIKSNNGIKISESISFDIHKKTEKLVEKVKGLSNEEQQDIIRYGKLSKVKDIINSIF